MNSRQENRPIDDTFAPDQAPGIAATDPAADRNGVLAGGLAEVSLPDDAHADSGRIASMLDAIAAVSDGSEGITRLAYTEHEREVHRLVSGWLRDLGMTTRTDAAGNTIAERPGSAPGYGAIGTGSHVDSVYSGGRFDGVAGVVAAVEAARLITEQDVVLAHPLRVVVFAAEEGARFGQACIGSKAAAGLLGEQELTSRRDRDGMSLGEAMKAVGLDPARIGEARWSREDWAAFLELHIEQGRVLEDEGIPIGVVDLISGSTRLQAEVTGQPSHTGGTPMGLRADALTAAAEIVLLAEGIASDPRHRGTRATVGRLTVHPGSITTIPGRVSFSVDLRDVDSDRQRETVAEIARRARAVCDRRGVRLAVHLIGDSSPVVLPIWLRELIGQVCTERSIPYRVLTSGASHDSQMVNHVVPAGMIFVPSKGGLSHVPEEWTSAVEIALGTDVLARSLLATDRLLVRLRQTAQSLAAG
jgi:allantoate deiminase